MRFHVLTVIAALALGTGAMVAPQSLQAADVSSGDQKAPSMGGGYTDVIPIPVNDPAVKQIAGALVKPEGAGPFPVVVYVPPCGGPNWPLELQQEKSWIDRLQSKGIATLVVDPFVPRGLKDGNCDKLLTVLADVQNKNEAVLQILAQGGSDAAAAVKAAKTLPGIDPKKVFVMGFSYGATASLYATQTNSPGEHDTDVAGVVAYYPLCADDAEASVPTLVLIGDRDDWTGPVAACEALIGKGMFEVVVYPGATHAFTINFDQPVEFAGHKMAHDEKASEDAAQRALAFFEAQLK
jgi:dienelactone hydrolase